MKKGQVFWVVWAAVVAAAGVFYFLVVYPKSTENSNLYKEQSALAARFLSTEDALTKDIVKEAEAKATGKRSPGKAALLLKDGEDGLLWRIYPLSTNLKKIPNEFTAKAKQEEDKALVDERGRFVERFKDYQFAVDQTLSTQGKNQDFLPAPPADVDLFMDWVTGGDGQDARIDKEFTKLIEEREKSKDKEEKKPPLPIIFQKSQPGGTCQWLDDGRFSGTVTGKEFATVRPEILKRLVLRRLVLMALAKAEARVSTLKGEPSDLEEHAAALKDEAKAAKAFRWEPETRRVQFIEKITFLDAKQFTQERKGRLSGAAPSPKEDPQPFRTTGVELRVKCHPAVIPALLKKLEDMGTDNHRPMAFWVERLSVQRAPGKPDWAAKSRGEAKVSLPDPLPPDFGYRYVEWPVTVEILGVIPEFDETLDPLPTMPKG